MIPIAKSIVADGRAGTVDPNCGGATARCAGTTVDSRFPIV